MYLHIWAVIELNFAFSAVSSADPAQAAAPTPSTTVPSAPNAAAGPSDKPSESSAPQPAPEKAPEPPKEGSA